MFGLVLLVILGIAFLHCFWLCVSIAIVYLVGIPGVVLLGFIGCFVIGTVALFDKCVSASDKARNAELNWHTVHRKTAIVSFTRGFLQIAYADGKSQKFDVSLATNEEIKDHKWAIKKLSKNERKLLNECFRSSR